MNRILASLCLLLVGCQGYKIPDDPDAQIDNYLRTMQVDKTTWNQEHVYRAVLKHREESSVIVKRALMRVPSDATAIVAAAIEARPQDKGSIVQTAIETLPNKKEEILAATK